MSEEIDPNLPINSDLFPSFTEGFTSEVDDRPVVSDGINRLDPNRVDEVCCDGCTCTQSHSSTPVE